MPYPIPADPYWADPTSSFYGATPLYPGQDETYPGNITCDPEHGTPYDPLVGSNVVAPDYGNCFDPAIGEVHPK